MHEYARTCIVADMPITVGIFGASGYTGAELLRLAAAHPDFEIALATAAGGYVPAAARARAPLIRSGAVDPAGIIVDAATGVSGAGRKLSHTMHFGTVNEDFTAYGLLNHRHTPEIEQASGAVDLL